MTSVLDVQGAAIRFGGVAAVAGVSFSLSRGEITGLIGPNGAGKTTLLRIIAGIFTADAGRIVLAGADVTRLPTEARVRKGLALTHQIVRPFRSMSVLDNVSLAAGHRLTRNPFLALARLRRAKEEERARAILGQIGLAEVAQKSVASLSLGHLRRLEIARALAVEPMLLLLDEPLAGLNHSEAAQLVDVLAGLNATGITMLLIEHNLGEVMRACRRLLVLDQGALIADAAPDKVMAEPAVRAAYLGKDKEHAAA